MDAFAALSSMWILFFVPKHYDVSKKLNELNERKYYEQYDSRYKECDGLGEKALIVGWNIMMANMHHVLICADLLNQVTEEVIYRAAE